MKNKTLGIALLLIIVTMLSACYSIHDLVIDEDNPADQNATIVFISESKNGFFYIKEWNDVKIKDDLYGRKSVSSSGRATLTVPAGDNSFVFDVTFVITSNSYGTSTASMGDIELQYFLEAQKKYQVRGRYRSLGLFKGREFFVGIYDGENRNVLLKEWKLGEV